MVTISREVCITVTIPFDMLFEKGMNVFSLHLPFHNSLPLCAMSHSTCTSVSMIQRSLFLSNISVMKRTLMLFVILWIYFCSKLKSFGKLLAVISSPQWAGRKKGSSVSNKARNMRENWTWCQKMLKLRLSATFIVSRNNFT